jgi:HAMP domain-containing protein
VSAFAYYYITLISHERFDQTGSLLAINLSDAAAGYILRKEVLQLDTLSAKYGRLDGVAYALIQDQAGNIVANSQRMAPPNPISEADNDRWPSQRSLMLQGRRIEESAAPILDGRLGTARVGIWTEGVDREIRRGLLVFVLPVGVLFVTAAIVALWLSVRWLFPLRRITEIAERVSTGELDMSVRLQSPDEFADLTNSLERLRASMKAAMTRLACK